MKRLKIITAVFFGAVVFCNVSAQNNAIFKGGVADGWNSRNAIQSSTNIFHGGSGDGWNAMTFSQSSSNIYKGGSGDGWNSINFIQGSTTIYKGGAGDGWNAMNFVQANKSIFSGGIADGWSSRNVVQANKSIFSGGIGDGWASTYRPQGPLPIKLLYFDATKYRQTSSLLKWETTQEINSAKFDVERSSDAITFTKIGDVIAAGNSSVSSNYNFIDNNPAKGMNYYRLKQIELDGRFVYTPARLVTFDELNASAVQYYPNPTKGILNIDAGFVANTPYVINITNAAGQVVNQIKTKSVGSETIHADLSRYAKGLYFIQMRTATLNSTQRVLLE